jgi:hypothetical protein
MVRDLNCSEAQRRIKELPKSLYDTFIENIEKLHLSYDKCNDTKEILNTVVFGQSDITMVPGDSYEKMQLFPDHSLDFIFIDGGHSEEVFKKDVEISKKKIKPNGWIGGHDHTAPHIQRIVNEEFKQFEGIKTSRNENTIASWLVRDVGI